MSKDAFVRLIPFFTENEFERILSSHVMIFGLGGVGSFALEALVRSGISRLTLVDFDDVKVSNINRQLFALNSSLNQKKTEVAFKRSKDINPDCQIQAENKFVSSDNLNQILSSKPDVVLDAIDTIKSKAEIIEYCCRKNIPCVTSMGAAGKRNPYMIEAKDLFKTKMCPLAKRLRAELRKRNIYKGVRAVYSIEQKKDFDEDALTLDSEDNGVKKPLGSYCPVTASFGLKCAHEVIEIIVNEQSKNKI